MVMRQLLVQGDPIFSGLVGAALGAVELVWTSAAPPAARMRSAGPVL